MRRSLAHVADGVVVCVAQEGVFLGLDDFQRVHEAGLRLNHGAQRPEVDARAAGLTLEQGAAAGHGVFDAHVLLVAGEVGEHGPKPEQQDRRDRDLLLPAEGEQGAGRLILQLVDHDIGLKIPGAVAGAELGLAHLLPQLQQAVARAEGGVDRLRLLKLLQPVFPVPLESGAVVLIREIELELGEIALGRPGRLNILKLARAVEIQHIAVEGHDGGGVHGHVVNLHIETVVVIRQAHHHDLIHRAPVHVDRDAAPALHLLVRVLLPPAGEVDEFDLPVLGGYQVLHKVSVLVGGKAQAHGFKLLVAVPDARAQHVKVHLVILDVKAGGNVQKLLSPAGGDGVKVDALRCGQGIGLYDGAVKIELFHSVTPL